MSMCCSHERQIAKADEHGTSLAFSIPPTETRWIPSLRSMRTPTLTLRPAPEAAHRIGIQETEGWAILILAYIENADSSIDSRIKFCVSERVSCKIGAC